MQLGSISYLEMEKPGGLWLPRYFTEKFQPSLVAG
jgi:hypothetical protein